jgi:hypothetical protein
MVTYCLIVAVVSFTKFKIPKPTPYNGVPPGNMLITNRDSEKIWSVISLDEAATQSMTVCEVDAERSRAERVAETVLCALGSVVSVATVLLVPTMSDRVKVYFIIQYAIGLCSCIIFSSRDKDATLSRNFTWYTITKPAMIRFSNRASDVAAAMLYTDAITNCVKDDIIPSDSSWIHFRSALDQLKDANLKNDIKKNVGKNPR